MQAPTPFNPIRGFKGLLTLKALIPPTFKKQSETLKDLPRRLNGERKELDRFFDEINYCESMLLAYDRDGRRPEDSFHGIAPKNDEPDPKDIRSALRENSYTSREAIVQILQPLGVPESVTSPKGEFESNIEWSQRIRRWIEDNLK